MINISKQIQYWQKGAYDDIETAKILIENGKLVHGLFFCHLSIEKIVKALVVKTTNLSDFNEISIGREVSGTFSYKSSTGFSKKLFL